MYDDNQPLITPRNSPAIARTKIRLLAMCAVHGCGPFYPVTPAKAGAQRSGGQKLGPGFRRDYGKWGADGMTARGGSCE